MVTIFNIVMLIWYILYVIFMIYLSLNESGIYSVDKIIESDDTALADLSLIMYKKIKPEVLTASIINLIHNGVIEVKKENDDYIFFYKEQENLSKSEFNLIEFLFNIVGENNKVSLNKLNSFCNNNAGCSEFLINYEIWKKMVTIESHKTSIFEPKIDYFKIKIFRLTGIVLFILNIVLKINNIFGFLIIIPISFMVYYFYHISKLTMEASMKYYGFLSLRHKIKENSSLLNNDIYLEYAIILKCYDSLAREKLDFVTKLDTTINKSYKRAFFKGNRRLFK